MPPSSPPAFLTANAFFIESASSAGFAWLVEYETPADNRKINWWGTTDYNTYPSLQYKTLDHSDGSFLLQFVDYPSYCLHPDGATIADGTDLVAYEDCDMNRPELRFNVISIDSETFMLQSVGSPSYCLHPEGAVVAEGNKVEFWSDCDQSRPELRVRFNIV